MSTVSKTSSARAGQSLAMRGNLASPGALGLWAVLGIWASTLGQAQAQSQSCLIPAGDVDGSGLTNVSDVQCFILTGLWSLSGTIGAGTEPACLSNAIYGAANANLDYILGADVNCDGNNDVSDVQLSIFLALKQKLPSAIDQNQDDCVDLCLFDSDGDNVPNAGDCAPYDPRIGNGRLDVCDTIDNNCDSIIDVPIGPTLAPVQPAEVCEDGLVCNGQATCPARPEGMQPVFTEVMLNPSGAPATAAARRWFEVFNPSDIDIDLRGWKIAGALPAEQFTITGARPVLIRAGGFAVFVADPDFADNGGVGGARGFRVIAFPPAFTVLPAGDTLRLVNPQGLTVDTVSWDASWPLTNPAEPSNVGRSLRVALAPIQDDPAGIGALNDSAGAWSLSTAPWQPVQNYAGGISTVESDKGSPGGLWTNGQLLGAPPTAERCMAGVASACTPPAELAGYACVAASCFEPGSPHPNAGNMGAPATVDSDATHYTPATGCLVHVAPAFDAPTALVESSACNDALACTDQACVLRVADPSSGFTATNGCHYTANATPSDSAGCYEPGASACIATGSSNAANFCEWCQPVTGANQANGYSPKPLAAQAFCDAAPGALGNPVALAPDGATLAGDSNPCTVHVCQGDGTCGVDPNQNTESWHDYAFPGAAGETCAELSCATDSCEPGANGPRCMYTHVGPGSGPGQTECLAPDLQCTSASADSASCSYPAFAAPTCLPAGATPAGGAAGCEACDSSQAVLGFSPKPAGTLCQGAGFVDRCTHFTCGGGVGATGSGPAGTCVNRGPWEELFCNTLPDAGCGAQQADNYECKLGGTGTTVGIPMGFVYYLDNSAPTMLSQPALDAIPPGAPFCGVQQSLCGTQCFIDGQSRLRGQLNPLNQCEWCNPDSQVTQWSPRVAQQPGYADTLAAALLLLTPQQTAAWTLGTSLMADLCRDDLSGQPNGAGADGNVCTVQQCTAGVGGPASCGAPVGWQNLEKDLRTPVTTNTNANANCLERVGNTVTGEDVSSCVQKVCAAPSGTPQCSLVANGGDNITTAPQCFIGGRCHASGHGNPFGVPGQPNTGFHTAQCASCVVVPGVPASFSAWQNESNGVPCNLDNNGCTRDVCQLGTCAPTGSGPPVSDGAACTLDACADGISDNQTFVTSSDPANDYAGGINLGSLTAFPPVVRAGIAAAGQTFNSIHTILPGNCLIAGQCYANLADAQGQPGFNGPGLAANGVCALCSPGAVQNTQVGMDSAPNPVNAQTSWTAPANKPCNDGVVCTVSDACTAAVGVCRGSRVDAVCNDGNPCTIDRCDDNGTIALPFPVLAGADAFPEVEGQDFAFAGCEYYAAPTTQVCEDAVPGTTTPDLCTSATRCAPPGGPPSGGPDGPFGSSPGQCQHGGADADPANEVVCADTNDCTFEFCRPDTGACVNSAVPFYFQGEHATTGAKAGGGSGFPLKLGLSTAQLFDPGFAYKNGAGTAMNPALVATNVPRRCDLDDWCTAGTCTAGGLCSVVDESDTAPNPANRKCSPANSQDFDTDNNSCSAPRCDATAGTWIDDPALPGAQWTVFVPTPEPDLLGGSLEWLDQSTGCYVKALADGEQCSAFELPADASAETNLGFDLVCLDDTLSVCEAGQCNFAPVQCVDQGNDFDKSCRTYTCSAAAGSTEQAQCVYTAIPAATCDDNNACTSQSCVATGGPASDPNAIQCVSQPISGAAIPPVGAAVDACALINSCHPTIGWHPNRVQLRRIDLHPELGAGGANWGAGLLNSTAPLTAAQRAALEAAEGSSTAYDVNGNGVVDGPTDVFGCPDNNACTAPDYCLVDGSCLSAPVPGCQALNANTLCVISGNAGDTVQCPVRLAVASDADRETGGAYAIQMTINYPPDKVKLVQLSDDVCFDFLSDELVCFTVPATDSGFSLAPSGHTVAFQPPLAPNPIPGEPFNYFANWNGVGTLLAADVNASGSPAPLNNSYFDPPFDPSTSLESHMVVDPLAPGSNLESPPHGLWRMDFVLLQAIPATKPVLVYANEIITVNQNANLVDNDVWNRIIVTRPFPPSPLCLGQANGTPCDDGDVCTFGDVCVSGACIPGSYFEGAQCGDANGACVACTVGECTTADPVPDECVSTGPDPSVALACAISGDTDSEADCWLYLTRTSAVHPNAVAHQLRLTWDENQLDLLEIYDKAGKALSHDNPLLGVSATTMAFAVLTFDDLLDNGDPTPIPNSSERHQVYLDPSLVGLATNAVSMAIVPRTLSADGPALTNATLVGTKPAELASIFDITVPPGTNEEKPGAFARLRFRVVTPAQSSAPHWVFYDGGAPLPAVAPTAVDASTLQFTISNTIVKTAGAQSPP
jgi:hypothetical protein